MEFSVLEVEELSFSNRGGGWDQELRRTGQLRLPRAHEGSAAGGATEAAGSREVTPVPAARPRGSQGARVGDLTQP